MARKVSSAGSNALLHEIYLTLKNKERTDEEEHIYQMIVKKFGTPFQESTYYYYKGRKDIAKVSFSCFYKRLSEGWEREKALLTPPVKTNSYNENRPKGKTRKHLRNRNIEQITLRRDIARLCGKYTETLTKKEMLMVLKDVVKGMKKYHKERGK